MGKCCRDLLWGSVAGTCCEEVVVKECCGEVLYGEVLRTGVVEKCCEGVVKWCRDVLWGSVV